MNPQSAWLNPTDPDNYQRNSRVYCEILDGATVFSSEKPLLQLAIAVISHHFYIYKGPGHIFRKLYSRWTSFADPSFSFGSRVKSATGNGWLVWGWGSILSLLRYSRLGELLRGVVGFRARSSLSVEDTFPKGEGASEWPQSRSSRPEPFAFSELNTYLLSQLSFNCNEYVASELN